MTRTAKPRLAQKRLRVGTRTVTVLAPDLIVEAQIQGRRTRIVGYTRTGREVRQTRQRTYLSAPLRFRYSQSRRYGRHEIMVHCGERYIGELVWYEPDGEILHVFVVQDRRRQGIATRMWEMAHRLARRRRGVCPPRHSGERTPAGEHWARAVGGHRPRWFRVPSRG